MEDILMSGATGILNKLSGVVAQEIGSAWGVKDDLKKLQETLQMILAVIADAERKQTTQEAVRLWLRWLKDVAYDADDVMDEFAYETMRRCERGDRLKHKVNDFVSSSNPLSFRIKMARKIRDINKSLDEITRKMDDFHLEIDTESDTTYGESSEDWSRQTTSFTSESVIVGREEDKNNLINMLTKVIPSSTSSDSDRNTEKVSVLSLVGMGGLGKTTLAQLIYTDELIKNQFELTMWVHVSEDFDVEYLLINIMESATQAKFDKLSNFDVLVKKVQEQIRGKKYLLVLDDLWNEDHEQWNKLKSVLLVGAQGSKILVTTRKDQVASIVSGTIPPYNLKQLSDAVCWSMMERKAFSPGGALHTQEMEDIGKEIAQKCCGLPLAAKFLGSLLRSKNQKSDWISIRDDDIWNTQQSQRNILPTLRLSYNNLPSHLRQCFSFCAIFPKNWEIERETLVSMWMAEGYLKTENKRSMEDLGNEYFKSLVWSSFFQHPNNKDDIETCKMHDLVHDLAVDVIGVNELASVKVSKMKDVSEFRRVQLNVDEDISTSFLKRLSDAEKLRSIFVHGDSIVDPTIFSRNKHLRILHVHGSGGLVTPKLPHLRLKLKHLRYLHLTNFNFSEAVNDRSISDLYNLETLVLTKMIGIQNLLSNIRSLKKLRHLDISFSHIQELPDSVTSLCNLQTLNLHACNLKSLPDSATGLKFLRSLCISGNLIEELPGFIFTLGNLEILNVSSCYSLKVIPESVALLTNLKEFYFGYCESLEALPEDFGALTRIRYLSLINTAIKVLPESCANLENLEYLHLSDCELPKEVTHWKKLKEFHYFGERTPMGIGELVFLQSLDYWVGAKEGDSGIAELEKLDLLEGLSIHGLENVRWLPDAETANLRGKQSLTSLGLYWGQEEKDHSIAIFEALQPPTGLKTLTIDGYSGMEFPTWMSCLPNLGNLELKDCSSAEKLSAVFGKLQSLWSLELTSMSFRSLDVEFPFLAKLSLSNIILLEELCCSYPCLQSLYIAQCSTLIKIPFFPSLTELNLHSVNHMLVGSIEKCCPSLTTLVLGNVEKLQFIPLSILQNNRNLKRLCIIMCNQFQGFRVHDDGNENEVALFGNEIQHGSTSVQNLVVQYCPELKFLPDLRGWTSLDHLNIFQCPKVKESLTYDLKSLASLQRLEVDFIQRDEQRGDPSNFWDLINLLE